ncbi:MAG TPA: SymE family type I addiction module toxin [Thermoanaerobaculia bacterium]|nr:SymE family type I addiction module toxin [Thermoanaerobaculia bacterium]
MRREHTGQRAGQQVPEVRLSGAWLRAAGFEFGQHLEAGEGGRW